MAGFDGAQDLRHLFEEPASFLKGHLFIVEEVHRPQDQDQAAGGQLPAELLLKQAHQLVTGEGPGHLHPGEHLPGGQTPGPALPDQAVGIETVGRVHHQHPATPGHAPGHRAPG